MSLRSTDIQFHILRFLNIALDASAFQYPARQEHKHETVIDVSCHGLLNIDTFTSERWSNRRGLGRRMLTNTAFSYLDQAGGRLLIIFFGCLNVGTY